MLEIRVATNKGWMALECECPAGRAMFSNEAAARAALEVHLRICVEAAEPANYRSFGVERDAA